MWRYETKGRGLIIGPSKTGETFAGTRKDASDCPSSRPGSKQKTPKRREALVLSLRLQIRVPFSRGWDRCSAFDLATDSLSGESVARKASV